MFREILQCEIFQAAVRVSVQQRGETQTHRSESEKTDVMFINLLVSSTMFMSCRQVTMVTAVLISLTSQDGACQRDRIFNS